MAEKMNQKGYKVAYVIYFTSKRLEDCAAGVRIEEHR